MLLGAVVKGAQARRERNRQEMRRNVLNIAERVVSEEGFEALTIRGIARELGYSPGAIYEYFENKEAILVTLFFHGTDGFVDRLEKSWNSFPPDADAISVFLQMGTVFRSFALENPELYRFSYNVMKQPADWGEEEGELPKGFDLIIKATDRGIAAGDLINADPITIAMSMWTAAHGFVSLEISGHFDHFRDTGVLADNDDVVHHMYRQCVQAVIRGWATDQGKAKLPG